MELCGCVEVEQKECPSETRRETGEDEEDKRHEDKAVIHLPLPSPTAHPLTILLHLSFNELSFILLLTHGICCNY